MDVLLALDRTGRSVHMFGAQSLPRNELAALVGSVHTSLASLRQERQPSLVPAVSVAESVKPDYLVCLEDGLRFRTLKRHLAVAYGMTPRNIAPSGTCPPTTRWWRPTIRACGRALPQHRPRRQQTVS